MVFKIKLLDKIKSLKGGFMLTEKQKKMGFKTNRKKFGYYFMELSFSRKIEKANSDGFI